MFIFDYNKKNEKYFEYELYNNHLFYHINKIIINY